MSGGNNLSRQTQVCAEVLDSLGSEVAIGMLPAVSKTDESTRLQRFHQRKNLEVGSSLDVRMGGTNGVFLHDENSLAEEVREDSDAVGLGNEHDVDVMELFWITGRSGRILSKQNTKSL